MRRRIDERPRMVGVTAVAIIVLVALTALLASSIGGGDGDGLAQTDRVARRQAVAANGAQRRVTTLTARLGRTERRVRTLERLARERLESRTTWKRRAVRAERALRKRRR